MIQPFEKIEGMSSDKFLARFVSKGTSSYLADCDRYNVMVEIDPWDKLVKFSCECKGFIFGKGQRLCKHVTDLLEILKEWEEIEEVPKLENG